MPASTEPLMIAETIAGPPPVAVMRIPSLPQPSWVAIRCVSQAVSEPTVLTAITLPLRSATVLIGEFCFTVTAILAGAPK